MITGFIKNCDLIQEDSRVEDLLDFSESIDAFSKKLDSIDRPAIIGLVGKFGIGKSTMLYQIQKESPGTEKWINFDAWKYPDRKDLWEGFVLDFADQVGNKKKTIGKINGKDTKSKTIDIISGIANAIPGVNITGSFTDVFKSSPAKRVFEIQNILTKIIEGQKKDIYIVIEDIDRSGDAGIYFLETLKQFSINLDVSNKLIVIVPMSDDNYYENTDSYNKCVDYFEFFSPRSNGLSRFVDAVFDESCFQKDNYQQNKNVILASTHKRTQIISFCEELLKQSEITIRLLKIILRKADMIYKQQIMDGWHPDWRVTICFESSKYSYDADNNSIAFFDQMKKDGFVSKNTIYGSFLYAIFNDNADLFNSYSKSGEKQLIKAPVNIKCIARKNQSDLEEYPSVPWRYGDRVTDDGGIGITDFYLDY